MEYLLKVNNLQTTYQTDKGEVVSVKDVSFTLKPGEIMGIVGESGSGKSVTSLSVMQLLGKKGRVRNGEIIFEKTNLLDLNEKQIRKIRGNKISMIFQEPMTSLNPIFTIGYQMIEAIRLHLNVNKKDAKQYAIEMLKKVGMPRPETIIKDYPHALSGGMRQRVMIAMAMVCKPKLLIADEPTTALDVTIQAQILELMRKLRDESDTSIMIITHDLGVISEIADKVIVMYAGSVVEEADVFTLFDNPKHPYTKALMAAIPQIDARADNRLTSISGNPPSVYQNINGCRFHTRCRYATVNCSKKAPLLKSVGKNHIASCWLVEKTMENEEVNND